MRKILTIATREYRAMVATKAFLLSVTMMPLLMFGGLVTMEMLQNVGEIKDLKIIVIDHTNQLYQPLNLAAKLRNKLYETDEQTATDSEADLEASGIDPKLLEQLAGDPQNRDEDDDFGSFSRGARFLLERWESSEVTDQIRLELCERIRNQELYAFIEIPADVLTAELPQSLEDFAALPSASFYSEDSTFSDAKIWFGQVINEFAKQYRLKELDIDPILVAKSSLPVRVRGMGLLERSSDGSIQAAEEKDDLSAILLPLGVLMLMFMVIFMAAQPMLESVLEEKSQRIAEVLLGSANPFQIMTGKLMGTVAGSLTIFAIYLGGAYVMAVYRGWTEYIPFGLIPWFVIFQVGGVLFYSSIFMAVGASVTQLKEAQSILLPVWLLLMTPMFIWMMVVREPNGPLAFYFSLFPPATPTMMMLRMSTGATIPVWQPILGMAVLVISTIFCVYVASRIFRVGLLWQGKTPKVNEIIKWAFRG